MAASDCMRCSLSFNVRFCVGGWTNDYILLPVTGWEKRPKTFYDRDTTARLLTYIVDK